MNPFRVRMLFLLMAIASVCMPISAGEEQTNIVLIMADDLGYGELGAYGQEKIETPNIDALAERGMKFSQFYSGAPVCAPARCVLLTGKHSGHAYIRGNDGWGARGDVWNFKKASNNPELEGQRPIPDATVTLAERLRESGYTTASVGKWGLGGPLTEGRPTNQGFDYFFGYNCQRQAHTYYPLHLWENDEKVKLKNDLVIPHKADLPQGADPRDPESYSKFRQPDYAPELMIKRTLSFLESTGDKPFFLYYAPPIPHVPLQAPERWVEYYHRKFGDESPYTGGSYFPNRYPRATYAAMISYLDENVGRLVKKLQRIGEYKNTVILFTSDNGPTYTGGVDASFFNSAGPFKNSRGWTKGYLHEGGIRVPLIASWPGHIDPGTQSDLISAGWDLMPTLLDIAGVSIPEDTDGISLVPELTGSGEQTRHDYLYWEFSGYKGQQAVRMGKWKGLRERIKKGNLDIQLFNLAKDLQETNDVSDRHPDVVETIRKIMKTEHETPRQDSFFMEALEK